MKNIYLYIILVAGIFSMSSCSNTLDIAPDGTLTWEEILSDPNRVEGLVNSCYRQLPGKNGRYYFWEPQVVSMSDDAWSSADAEDSPIPKLYNGQMSASSHPMTDNVNGHDTDLNNYWERYWEQIRLCNQFLEFADLETTAFHSQASKNRLIAEVRVLRAYFYHELIKWFGKLPVVTEVYDPASDFSDMRRQPVPEVVKLIEEDCRAAIDTDELPWRITQSSEGGRVTKAVAYTIMSKMWLFAASPLHRDGGDYWKEAYEINKEALEALTDPSRGGYELYSQVANTNLFGNGDEAAWHEMLLTDPIYTSADPDKESIWVSTVGGQFAWNINYVAIAVGGHKAGACPTQELVDAFETKNGEPILDLANPYEDTETHLKPRFNPNNTAYNETVDRTNPYTNRDPRFYATVVYNGCELTIRDRATTIYTNADGNAAIVGVGGNEKNTRTGYYHRKLVRPGSDDNRGGNNARWKYFRLAEVYLNFAEAACEYNRLEEAWEAVNTVRARVKMPALPDRYKTDQAGLRLRIRNERRVEFAWEEHRYYDLRRWQEPTGNLEATCKYFTAMEPIMQDDGSFRYTRKPIRETPRYGHSNRDLFLPIPLAEANRMETSTGVKWQNPGW